MQSCYIITDETKHSLKARQAKAPKALNDQSPALCSNPMHFVTRWPIGHAHPVRFGIMEIPHITPPGKDSFILYSSNPEQHHMRNLSCVKAFTDQRDEITCPIYWVTRGPLDAHTQTQSFSTKLQRKSWLMKKFFLLRSLVTVHLFKMFMASTLICLSIRLSMTLDMLSTLLSRS